MKNPDQPPKPSNEVLQSLASEMFEVLQRVPPLLDAFDGDPWIESKTKIQGIMAKVFGAK